MSYVSKYAQAWAILKEFKSLTLTLDSPRVERTVRKAIIEHKKLDKDKSPLERIKVKKSFVDGRVTLHFTLLPSIRYRTEFFDLDRSLTSEKDIEDDPTDIDLF